LLITKLTHTAHKRKTKLHWCLDVGMNEDACLIRRDKASENLAGIRHIAMNYLKMKPASKMGLNTNKRKRQ